MTWRLVLTLLLNHAVVRVALLSSGINPILLDRLIPKGISCLIVFFG